MKDLIIIGAGPAGLTAAPVGARPVSSGRSPAELAQKADDAQMHSKAHEIVTQRIHFLP